MGVSSTRIGRGVKDRGITPGAEPRTKPHSSKSAAPGFKMTGGDGLSKGIGTKGTGSYSKAPPSGRNSTKSYKNGKC